MKRVAIKQKTALPCACGIGGDGYFFYALTHEGSCKKMTIFSKTTVKEQNTAPVRLRKQESWLGIVRKLRLNVPNSKESKKRLIH